SAATWLPMVPEATKSAASLPNRSAARASRRFTVGSSSKTSSPTSAAAIAARMAGVGVVTVSERRSTMSCMTLPGLGGQAGRRALAGPPRPLAGGVLLPQPLERLIGLVGALQPAEGVGLEEEGLGGGGGAGVVLEDHLVPLERRLPVLAPDVVVGDPQLLLGQPEPARLDLHDRVRRVAALRVLLDELLELGHRLAGHRLVPLDRGHVV